MLDNLAEVEILPLSHIFPLIFTVSFQKANYLLLYPAFLPSPWPSVSTLKQSLSHSWRSRGTLENVPENPVFLIKIQRTASSLSHHHTMLCYCCIKSQREQLPGLWEKGVKAPDRCDTCNVSSALILSLQFSVSLKKGKERELCHQEVPHLQGGPSHLHKPGRLLLLSLSCSMCRLPWEKTGN